MDKAIDKYWQIRLTDLKEALDANNFETFVVASLVEAKNIVLETILPATAPKSVSWGGSMTLISTGLYDELKNNSKLKVLDTFDKKLSPEESLATG
jgi:hypothetical protein